MTGLFCGARVGSGSSFGDMGSRGECGAWSGRPGDSVWDEGYKVQMKGHSEGAERVTVDGGAVLGRGQTAEAERASECLHFDSFLGVSGYVWNQDPLETHLSFRIQSRVPPSLPLLLANYTRWEFTYLTLPPCPTCKTRLLQIPAGQAGEAGWDCARGVGRAESGPPQLSFNKRCRR